MKWSPQFPKMVVIWKAWNWWIAMGQRRVLQFIGGPSMGKKTIRIRDTAFSPNL